MSFAKSYKFTMIALALCAVGFIACSDSDSSGDANGEDNVLSIWVGDMLANGDTLILGMGEGLYEMSVESSGEWRFENGTTFIDSIYPESGSGDAVVKIHVKKNDSDERLKGELRVVYPEDTDLNTSMDVWQVYSGDYGDNMNVDDNTVVMAFLVCGTFGRAGIATDDCAINALNGLIGADEMKNRLLDYRDWRIYKTTVIKSQVWMAENLRYDSEGGHTYCFNDDKANCRKYGRLYNYYAAKAACPDGWHLPSKAEWLTLINELGGEAAAGKALKSTSGWKSEGNGDDDYKFSALPVGYSIKDTYYGMDEETQFWASTSYGGNTFYLVSLNFDNDSAAVRPRAARYGLSVRCLKD